MKEHQSREPWRDFTLPDSSTAERRTSPGDAIEDMHYPSIERLFDDYPESLREARRQLMLNRQQLERVIRQGSRQEAVRASRAVVAYDHTLSVLDELEGRYRGSSPENSSAR